MKEIWQSLKDFFTLSGRIIWVLLIEVIIGVAGALDLFGVGRFLTPTHWGYITIITALIACFWAFHKVRIERDEKNAARSNQTERSNALHRLLELAKEYWRFQTGELGQPGHSDEKFKENWNRLTSETTSILTEHFSKIDKMSFEMANPETQGTFMPNRLAFCNNALAKAQWIESFVTRNHQEHTA